MPRRRKRTSRFKEEDSVIVLGSLYNGTGTVDKVETDEHGNTCYQVRDQSGDGRWMRGNYLAPQNDARIVDRRKRR